VGRYSEQEKSVVRLPYFRDIFPLHIPRHKLPVLSFSGEEIISFFLYESRTPNTAHPSFIYFHPTPDINILIFGSSAR
jgi:hypothetical protein